MVVLKTMQTVKPPGYYRKKSLLVAQEISFAKVLAGNSKKLRDRGVKRLRKWLSTRSRNNCELKKDDFMRLWKGLFYCMWMADKPLFQEELAETISSLVHCFHLSGPSITFMEGFFETLALEWKGIDQHRLDKFLMFVRRFLRQCLVFAKHHEWNSQIVEDMAAVFQRTLLPDHAMLKAKTQPPLGLVMHFTEIFLEELAKVSKGSLDEDILLLFLKPFVHHLSAARDSRILSHIRRHIFMRLLEQSPVGLEFQDKFYAWKKLGFPGGSIDVMQRSESDAVGGDEDEEDDEMISNAVADEEVLDPRAGHIDVELPLINFNAQNVAKFLADYQCKKYTNAKTRKILADLISKFEKLAAGDYPLGMKVVPEIPFENMNELTEEAAEDLMEYVNGLDIENDCEEGDEIEYTNDKSESESKGKKKKQRLLSKENTEDNEKLKRDNKNKKKQKFGEITRDEINNSEDGNRGQNSLGVKVNRKDSKTKLKLKKSKSIKSALSQAMEVSSDEVAAKPHSEDISITAPVTTAGNSILDETPKSSSQPYLMEQDNSETKPAVQSGVNMIAQKKSLKLKRRASLPNQLPSSNAEVVDSLNTEESLPILKSQEKKSRKRISLWEEDLKDGEYEIFIPREDFLNRKRKLSNANDSLNLSSSSGAKLKNPFSSPAPGTTPSARSSSNKKVNFVLHRNTSQATSDYFRTLRENPAIPFDATKEPTRSVLRPSPYNSPVNPFYKRKLKV